MSIYFSEVKYFIFNKHSAGNYAKMKPYILGAGDIIMPNRKALLVIDLQKEIVKDSLTLFLWTEPESLSAIPI